MWCQGELDSRLGFPAYGCVELDDNFSPIQPTFPAQGLESLFNESCLSSLSDNFGEFLSQTGGIPADYSTIFPSQQQSLNNVLSYGSHQDTSGTDSSVCGLTDHHSPSIGTGSELKNVCLLPSEILDFPQEDWTESEEKQVKQQPQPIKKECNSPTQKKEDWNWISELNFADGNCTFTNGVSFTSNHTPVPPQTTVPAIKRRKLTEAQNLIRRAKVVKYLEKRKRRNWGHTIRYASRKAYAENRPRIKGRFAKQEEVDALQKRKPKLEQKCKSQV